MHLLRWLRTHDAGYSALRRATRTALVMPTLFAIATVLLHDPALATFAAFGSFALLLLTDVNGGRSERVLSLAAIAGAGLVLVALGTLASVQPILAAAAMTVVAFVILFLGVVSSGLAAASTALLLAFVLPVATPGPLSQLPDRLAGWLLASLVAVLAVAFCWPAPVRDPLRAPLVGCCRLLAERLRATSALHALNRAASGSAASGPAASDSAASGPGDTASGQALRDRAAETRAASTVAYRQLRTAFFATPNRPTALSSGPRILIRLIDELGWLTGILDASPAPLTGPPRPDLIELKEAAAEVLDAVADTLDPALPHNATDLERLAAACSELDRLVGLLERAATVELPVLTGCLDGVTTELVDALEPTFRAQEVAAAVGSIGANAELAARAERRAWWERLLGRRAEGLGGPLASARERARAHLQPHSVWLHNSIRGAIGLGLAVLVADLTGVQHSFWVVLGTLSVLRSNALSTGQNVARGLLGTAAGILIGGVLVTLLAANRPLLWVLLPICIVLAGLAPAAISFAAGQAAFTVTLVILFNIISPVGYRVGLVRIEDIAIGCGVSLLVGVLFWPRGAASALGRALAEAYRDTTIYLRQAVDYGIARCGADPGSPPAPLADATAAAAAARRLDDAFREYLAERGRKQLPFPDVTGLVTGVVAPRLAADAVLRLWLGEAGTAGGDRAAAGAQLSASAQRLVGWYAAFADALERHSRVPDAEPADSQASARLLAAVRRDLVDRQGMGTTTAVRMIWTGDHLDAIRRLQGSLVGPAAEISTSGSGGALQRNAGAVRSPAGRVSTSG